MAFRSPLFSLSSAGSGIVFLAGFILGSLACLIFQFAVNCAQYLRKWSIQDDKTFNMDAAEKGGLKTRTSISIDEDLFSLEKRAFFSQSWLFVCHRSRFTKAGDYHTFSIAGKPFFIVLGNDLKLRAFHNVCRHRAYTVVRRAQGSSLRFSCKYHGWQYDSQGKLVKAPQFENTGGFNMQNNGLYEIVLHVDAGGFIFLNFASNAACPPIWTSSPQTYGDLVHCENFEILLGVNWRFALQHLVKSDGKVRKRALGGVWRLLSVGSDKNDRPLGPLAMLQNIDRDIVCTICLLPESSSNTTIRFDIYCIGNPRTSIVREFKSQMQNNWAGLEKTQAEEVTSEGLSLRQVSMLDEIDELLFDHRQREQRAGRMIDPATKTQAESREPESVMLCHALERPSGTFKGCPKQQELGPQLEW